MPEENDLSKNTYVIDAENAAEMARLITQDRILTRCMGGLFQPQLDLTGLHNILDIACGPGGWALDVARAYPALQVTGIDISRIMTEFDRYQAREQELPNAHFVVMNALKPLDFPDNSFDFVNARFVSSFIPRSAWGQFMQETKRVLRPGGTIRLTEYEANICNSFAIEKLGELTAKALQKAGLSFSPTGWQVAITPMLGKFLRDAGYQHIEKTAHIIDASAGAVEYTSQFQNTLVAGKLIQPFLVKMGVTTPQEAESLYEQAIEEMMAPDYCALFYFLSAWGEKPREQ